MTVSERPLSKRQAVAFAGIAMLLVAGAPPPGMTPAAFEIAKSVIEADAATAPPNAATPFDASVLAGSVILGVSAPAPILPCRRIILSTSIGYGGGRYVGAVCLSPSTHRWSLTTLEALGLPAPKIALKPGIGPIAQHPAPFPPHAPIAPQAVEAFVAPAHHDHPAIYEGGQPAPAPPQYKMAEPATAPPTQYAYAPVVPHSVEQGAAPYGEAHALAAPHHQPVGVVDAGSGSVQQQLQSFPIQYNRPVSLAFDHDTQMKLVVESQSSGDDAMAGAAGQVVHAHALVGTTETAHLSGVTDEVQITPLTSETQTITNLSNVVWTWNVRAKAPGQTTLVLELSADILVKGQHSAFRVTTYTDRFPVVMGPLSRTKWIIQQINPVYQFLGLGTPVVLLGALFAFLRRRASRGGGPPAGS